MRTFKKESKRELVEEDYFPAVESIWGFRIQFVSSPCFSRETSTDSNLLLNIAFLVRLISEFAQILERICRLGTVNCSRMLDVLCRRYYPA